jgi:hypothetical protein
MARHPLFVLGVLALLAGACVAGPTPISTPTSSLPLATPIPASAPALDVSCTPDPDAGNISVVGDPCPNAIAAVRGAVAKLGYPILELVVRPGPFECGIIWPGVQSGPVCFGPIVIPGRAMSAWVSFSGTNRVAVVSLWRDLPTTVPIAIQSPWTATLVDFAVPPDGWTMP